SNLPAKASNTARYSGICHSTWNEPNGTIGSNTSAGPEPTEANAIVSPSSVCAYRTRGSTSVSYRLFDDEPQRRDRNMRADQVVCQKPGPEGHRPAGRARHNGGATRAQRRRQNDHRANLEHPPPLRQ